MKIVIAAAVACIAASPALANAGNAAEANRPPNAPVVSPDGSLYRAFGGHEGVVRVVDDMYANVMADDRIKGFFQPAKQPHTKAMLVEQFCQIMGGGCVYSGKDMEATHHQLGITKADFDALVEDLQISMTRNHIPFNAQNQLLAALAPQSRAIIYRARPEDNETKGPVSP